MHLFIKIRHLPKIAWPLIALALVGCGNKGDLFLDRLDGSELIIQNNEPVDDTPIDESLDELEVLEAEEAEEADASDDDEDGDDRDDDESKEQDAS